jgi:ribonuclease J
MQSTLPVTFLSLGGAGTVTKNMFLYRHDKEILIVDCGLGFADETMLGVDLLLPDISPLLQWLKDGCTISGMVITHGHEDHMGALPFILPQLPSFPIIASPFTATMANAKLVEYALPHRVKSTGFRQSVAMGSFRIELVHVTHSIPDTAHVFIRTPSGNFYHGSDFKFDQTPTDGKRTDFAGIIELAKEGIRCLMVESLGADREGYTPSEERLESSFRQAIEGCRGRCIVTTYSSHVNRINLIARIAREYGRSVCFIGRSLMKVRDLAREQGILDIPPSQEVRMDQLRRIPDQKLVLFVAGSQGQDQSALTRMINGEHREISLKKTDVVIFSADPIPGNEISVHTLIDTLAQHDIPTRFAPGMHMYHVSGHGSQEELHLLMTMTHPEAVLPISGNFRHAKAFADLAGKFGYTPEHIVRTESGEIVHFYPDRIERGGMVPLKTIYVDQMSGEEVDQYVLHDRQQLSQEGMVVVIAEIQSQNGSLSGQADLIARGFSGESIRDMQKRITTAIQKTLPKNRTVTNWSHIRKLVKETAEREMKQRQKVRPLVIPVVIEV